MEYNPQKSSAKLGRYANITLDRWFKRTFGTEPRKRLLQLLLAELIPERTIQSLTYAPQEHVNPFPDNKDVRVDVECTDTEGKRFVIEMQLAPQNFFYDRALFNSTFAIQEQVLRGESPGDTSFPPVYFIGIMSFSLHTDSDRVLYRYRLREDVDNGVMTEKIQFLFLEMPNCRKARTPQATVLDNFCYALMNLPALDDQPEELHGELFNLLFNSAEIATFTAKERIQYEKDMRTEQDFRNQLAYARQEGRKEGRMEGRQEGRAEGREEGARQAALETARKMLAKGIPVNVITECTGLSEADLQAL